MNAQMDIALLDASMAVLHANPVTNNLHAFLKKII
jgi:hypothetical protein